jgi:hypothetical protein
MGLPPLPRFSFPARIAAVTALAALVAACGSSVATPVATVAGATSAPTVLPATAAPTVASTVPASGLELPTFTAVPTSLDPCQLVPPNEASALAGASYTAGKEDTTSGNGKICWYGSGTKNVFEVVVAVAPDAASAQQAKDAALAQVNSATGGLPINTSQVSGVGDTAEFVSFSALTLDASGLYVLKGAVFFALVDEVNGGNAPSQAALVAEARTVISRLP